jgi:glycosyltransferase involved in cell wall biosynthesis
MHLHFVQSLEPLQGAGLGQAALSLHLAMRGETKSLRDEKTKRLTPSPSPLASKSVLLSTRAGDFGRAWPDVIQGVRKGHPKMFYAPELKRLAAEVVGQAEWFHGHGLYVWTNMWLGGEARKRGKPLVYHPHGFFDPWILRRSPGKKRLAHWLFEDKNIAHVRWWRAVSNKEAEQIRAVVGDRAVVHVIPNGVDLHEVDAIDTHEGKQETGDRGQGWPGATVFRKGGVSVGDTKASDSQLVTRYGAWTRRRRPKRLLFLSRIHAKKGLDLLVPAWGKLTGEFPDWELLIVGPDEGGYQATVEKMIEDCACSETCGIHPAVSGVEKHALLRTADLFVLPSYSEGFPMAVLEAAAHRIPVVQTDECNFPELTAAGGAWACRPELESVEKALRDALTAEDAERAERGLRGRELVERSYSWDQIADQVLAACSA